MITVKTFVEGPIEANNYLLVDDDSKEAILIDCSSARDGFVNAIKNSGVKLKYILLTHGHFDHILGLDGFRDVFDAEVYLAKDDMEQVKMLPSMMQMFLGMSAENPPKIDKFIDDGDEFYLGNTVVKAISTPGHTPGGMSFFVEDKLFSGDTLFLGSVGRCDLPGGDFKIIVESIKNKLFTLSDNVIVYPGHGPSTTIEREKKFNEIINY